MEHMDAVEAIAEKVTYSYITQADAKAIFQALIQSVGANPEEGIRVWWEKCGHHLCKDGKDAWTWNPCPTCNGSGGTYRAEAYLLIRRGLPPKEFP